MAHLSFAITWGLNDGVESLRARPAQQHGGSCHWAIACLTSSPTPMSSSKSEQSLLPLADVPTTVTSQQRRVKRHHVVWIVCYGVFLFLGGPSYIARTSGLTSYLSHIFGVNKPISPDTFFWTRNDAGSLCNDSYSGYIGLKGETAEEPRRSFYWSVCRLGAL